MRYQIDISQLSALLRERRGMRSLRIVATESGVSPATLSRLEHAQRAPDMPTFLAVCSWLGVHPADLITDTDAAILMPMPTLAQNTAYALAPLDAPIRDALLIIVEALHDRA